MEISFESNGVLTRAVLVLFIYYYITIFSHFKWAFSLMFPAFIFISVLVLVILVLQLKMILVSWQGNMARVGCKAIYVCIMVLTILPSLFPTKVL